ncbi:NFACT family protein [Mobilitalea sibirica]|uniref:Rqc2 homolog RqcH n=1 Tax=Mobilitalea sibirica TaxID=1462919 RepID=A0A8J7H8C2_9FIRM|nr:NFACT RNA binding domain-containing protein [Mobilitalea sibirica]MBH1940145.1 NFACT family protein [Mobilitalea sibirica]
MALDGIVIANVVKELQDALLGGRINKIAQPEKDELILTIKAQAREQYKLLLSAGAGLPLIYLTQNTKPSPLTAPNFCMLLRKHLNNARILDISQPGLERIVNIKLEHLDELGDVKVKFLIIELMGKHSNIIFCNEDMTIIDSIKRVNQFISSVREVLPGREYFIPETTQKADPLTIDFDAFQSTIVSKPQPIGKALYTSLTGISPLIANEICHRASLDSEDSMNTLNEATAIHLYRNLERLMEEVKTHAFVPNIISLDGSPVEFSSVMLTCYDGHEIQRFDSVSAMLETYYASKSSVARIRQKSADLRKIVANAIDRAAKKYDLQLKQLKDTDKRDKFKVYGELITTYGYELQPGAKELKTVNYYTNEEITIPLDPTITPMENAKHYFEKYNKLKRTYDALTTLIKETADELSHLESIKTSLDIATEEHDLTQLKQELMDYGYIKRKYSNRSHKPDKKNNQKKTGSKSQPFHYISSDGYHMYVGKNNFQNDELTFQFADGGDWWFHAKKLPGSHVIVKAGGDELPDRTFEEAAKLAAYYSGARDADKVEIDYTLKKNIKKPGGGKPGFVVYYTNYSMISDTDITGITQIE